MATSFRPHIPTATDENARNQCLRRPLAVRPERELSVEDVSTRRSMDRPHVARGMFRMFSPRSSSSMPAANGVVAGGFLVFAISRPVVLRMRRGRIARDGRKARTTINIDWLVIDCCVRPMGTSPASRPIIDLGRALHRGASRCCRSDNSSRRGASNQAGKLAHAGE